MTQTLTRPAAELVLAEAERDPFLAIVSAEKFVITVTPETLILAMRAVVSEHGQHTTGVLHRSTNASGLVGRSLRLLGVDWEKLNSYDDFMVEGDAGIVPDGIFHLTNGSAAIADLADERDQDGWLWAEIADAAEQLWADNAHTRF